MFWKEQVQIVAHYLFSAVIGVLCVDAKECNCGPYGSCSFQYGQKTCNCRPFALEKNGICIIMKSTTSESTTALRTTMLLSTTQYCNCGEYSKSCRYNWKGDKICDCFPGYAEKYGSCE
ncbi:hypothetical protein AVEN_64551-1, partial [Araneus ventricosus]